MRKVDYQRLQDEHRDVRALADSKNKEVSRAVAKLKSGLPPNLDTEEDESTETLDHVTNQTMRHLEALREDSKMRRFERDDAKSAQILAEKRLQEH